MSLLEAVNNRGADGQQTTPFRHSGLSEEYSGQHNQRPETTGELAARVAAETGRSPVTGTFDLISTRPPQCLRAWGLGSTVVTPPGSGGGCTSGGNRFSMLIELNTLRTRLGEVSAQSPARAGPLKWPGNYKLEFVKLANKKLDNFMIFWLFYFYLFEWQTHRIAILGGRKNWKMRFREASFHS